MRSHAHTQAHTQISLGEGKIAHTYKFLLPYITHAKKDVVFKDKPILCCLCFLTLGHYLVVKTVAVLHHLLLTHLSLLRDSKKTRWAFEGFILQWRGELKLPQLPQTNGMRAAFRISLVVFSVFVR